MKKLYYYTMNNNKIIFYAYLYLFCNEVCMSQVKVGDWISLTSCLQIRDIAYIDNILFAATEGGILTLDEQENSVITNIDGLSGVDILTIEKDMYDNLWIGGNSPYGFLQSYDPFAKKSLSSFDLPYKITSGSLLAICLSIIFSNKSLQSTTFFNK